MKSDLFRKNAVESMATPEMLDRHVRIVKPSMWLLWVAGIIGFVTIILWGITYNISDGIDVGGVIFTSKDIVNVGAKRDDILADVLVKSGEYVESGDIVAVMRDDETLKKINEYEDKLGTLEPESEEYSGIQKRIELLRRKYSYNTVIKTDYSGYVQSVKNVGNMVSAGETIVSVMSDSGYDELIAYVPFEYTRVLELGMETQVTPCYADREEFGYMIGVITSISSVPATEESIIKNFGTISYVDGIIQDSTCVEVRIKLDPDMNSSNRYKWSNPKGEKLSVGYGTQCDVRIIMDTYHPYELLFN